MPIRSGRRRAGRIAGVTLLVAALCVTAGVGAGMARPQRAAALPHLLRRYPPQQTTVTRDPYCAEHQAG